MDSPPKTGGITAIPLTSQHPLEKTHVAASSSAPFAPDFMTKICKKAAQDFHCAVLKVFDRVKSVALWSAKIRKVAQDHKGYGSAASNKGHISNIYISLR
jgi:hypothetical protein